jgi:hypothetical protein
VQLNKPFAEILYANPFPSLVPKFNFLLENDPGALDRLHSCIQQDEVLDFLASIQPNFVLGIIDFATAVFIYYAELVHNELRCLAFWGYRNSADLAETINSCIHKLVQLAPVQQTASIEIKGVKYKLQSILVLHSAAKQHRYDKGFVKVDLVRSVF